MISARTRSLVLVTAVSTSLSLAVPAVSAASSRHAGPFVGHRARSSLTLSGQHAHARIDAALLTKRGRVDVMLQLAPAAAVAPYASVKAPRARLGAARLAAFRAQLGRIGTAQRALTSRLHDSATRGQTLFALHNLYDGVAVRTDAARLAALANLPGVVAVHALVPKHVTNAVTVPMIGGTQAWSGPTGDIGVTSTGDPVRIGVIDTGIDYTHADFGGPGTVAAYDAAKATDTQAPQWTAKVAGGFDFAGDSYDGTAGLPGDPDPNPADATPQPDANPLDCSGHGTHVAGTAAGYGVNANGSTFTGDYSSLAGLTPSQYQAQFAIGPGVAPGATLYALKIFGCAEESSTGSDLISAALDWAADPNGDGNPADHLDVVNMSLGADFTSSSDPDAVAADNASLAGVTVVAAAGNAGDEFNAAGAPGNAVRAVSVAASDDTTDLVDGVRFSDVSGDQPAEESSAYDWPGTNGPSVTTGPGLTQQLVTLGPAKTLATWRQPGDKNNSDGCDPLSAPDAAKVAGKIVLLAWTDNDSARRCGSKDRTDNASKAGAAGVVLADDEDEFSAGILGTKDIPTIITTKTASDQVATDVLAGNPTTATLTATLHNGVKDVHPGTADAVATFSSRGTGAAGLLKPDVSAPGVTVFSALFGSGNDGTSNNGTSMATPHVTGSAALVKAVHPTWTPEQVKAALMNTAGQDVYARTASSAADHNAPEAPERVGAGRVQADKAVADQVLAYATNGGGAVSVSFGPIATATVMTRSRAITVQNTGSADVTYTASYAAANANPGAFYTLTTTTCSNGAPTATVAVPAGGTAQLTVCLTIDPSSLTSHPDPTLTLKPALAAPYDIFNGLERSFISTVSGRVVLTSQSDGSTLRVPVYAAPRPASTTSAKSSAIGFSSTGAASLPLTGNGVDGGTPGGNDSALSSTVDAFELQGASGALPVCRGTALPPGCVPTPPDRAGDLKDIGFASDGPLYHAFGADPWAFDPAGDGSLPPALSYFGIASNWPWTTPDAWVFPVWIYLQTPHGPSDQPIAILYNTRVPGTDIFVSELASLDANGVPQFVYDDELLNGVDGSLDTHLFNSDVMTMPFAPVALKAIAADDGFLVAKTTMPDPSHPTNPDNYVDPGNRISYFVDSASADGQFLDSIGDPLDGGTPMSTDVVTPGISASAPAECNDPSNPQAPAATVCLPTLISDRSGSTLAVQRSAAVGADRPLGLLLLHHDNLDGKRAQVVKFTSSVTAASATAPYGQRYPLKVRVASSVGTPGGTVTVTEGATRLGSATLHGGAATVTLPTRTVGRHTLSVTYGGDAAHTGAARSVTLTVTKAATHTSLALSGTRSVTLTATTSVLSPGHAAVSGVVRFYDNGHWFATVRTTGKATARRRLSSGRHTLTAKYSGSSLLSASTGTRTHTA